MTFFCSLGKGAGIAEAIINMFFIENGYYYALSHIYFI